jgi:hypothetical protein
MFPTANDPITWHDCRPTHPPCRYPEVDEIWERRDLIIEAVLDRDYYKEGEKEEIERLAQEAHELEFAYRIDNRHWSDDPLFWAGDERP